VTVTAYNEHPLRSTIEQVLRLRTEPSMVEAAIGDNEQYTFARDKIFAMAEVVDSLLDSTPAVLSSVHALNQLNSHVQTALNELNAFIANKNPAHITNACVQFDQNVLPLLWGFAPQIQGSVSTCLPELFERMSQSASETIRQLAGERDKLTERVHETMAATDALNVRLETMSEGAARDRAEASAAVAKLEQAFAEKETARAAVFDTTLAKIKSDYSIVEDGTKGSSAALITELEEQRSKAAQIVQVVGNIGVTGNYQIIANAEAKQANFWRWVTVLFFACGVSLAVSTFVRFWAEPVTAESIWSIAIRLLYAIAITAPAWYTARESARHRTNADRARQTELELASLGPFIELLPPEKKVEIREQMTKLYFGREVEAHSSKPPLDAENIRDIAIAVAKVLKQ
jgi:hypothetical protein